MERQSFPSQIPRRWRWGGMLGEGPRVLGPRLCAPLLWGSEVLSSARAGRWAWGTPGGGGAQGPPAPWVFQRRAIWMARSAAESLGVFCSLAAQTPGSGIWHQYRPRSQNCHHRLCLNPDPGDEKDSSTGDEGRKGLWAGR